MLLALPLGLVMKRQCYYAFSPNALRPADRCDVP